MNRTVRLLFFIPAFLAAALLTACEDDSTVSKLLEEALGHRASGQWQAAVAPLKQYLQKHPDNGQARGLLGEIYLELGDAPSAIKELDRARSLGINSEHVRLLLARAWLMDRNSEAVLDEVPADLALESEANIELMVLRGRALLIEDRLPEAAKTIERVLEQGPNAFAFASLSQVFRAQKDDEGAEAQLRSGLEAFPEDSRLLTMLGEALLRRQAFDEAEATLLKAAARDASDRRWRYRTQVGLIQSRLALGKIEEAEASLAEMAAEHPEDVTQSLMSGFVALLKEDFETASLLSEKALNGDPNNTPAMFVSGAAAYYQGRIEEAHERLSRYVARVPDNLDARQLLALSQMRIGDAETAYQLLSSNGTSANHGARYMELLSDAARLAGHQETSLRALRQAVVSFPEDARIRAKLGLLRIATGDASEAEAAISDLEAAKDLDPDSVQTRSQLAVQYIRQGEIEKALELAKEVQADLPLSAIGYNLEGMALLRKGNDEAAVGLFRQAVEAEPAHLTSIVYLATTLERLGLRNEATELLEASLEHLPNNLALLLRLAEIAKSRGQVDKAEQYLKQASDANPNAEGPVTQLAGFYLEAGRPEEALGVANRSLSHFSRSAALLETMGKAQLRLARYTEASRTFRQLAKLNPDDPEPVYLLGRALEARGDVEEAQVAKSEAMEIATDDESLAIRLQEILDLLNAQDFEGARDAARRFQETNPDDHNGFTIEGMALIGLQAFGEAEQAFRKALELRPGAADASNNLASLALRGGDLDEARRVLQESLEHFPGHFQNLKRLADLEDRAGNEERSVELLQQAIELQPKAASAAIQLGRLQLLRGEPEKALQATHHLIPLYPSDPALLEIVGSSQLALGNNADAVLTFRSLVQNAKGQAVEEAHRLLATALLRAGNAQDAKVSLNKALAINPNHPRSVVLRARLHIVDGEPDEAAELIEGLTGAAANDPTILEIKGMVALMKGRPGDALEPFQQAFEVRPNSALALQLALAHWQVGDQSASVRTLEAWTERAPGDTRSGFQLAFYQLLAGDLDSAEDGFQGLLEGNPDSWSIHNNLAVTQLRKEDLQNAQSHAERALELSKGHPEVMSTLGLVRLAQGRGGEAVEMLREAAAKAPGQPAIRYRYARALAGQGERELARQELERALSGGAFHEIEDARALLDELSR